MSVQENLNLEPTVAEVAEAGLVLKGIHRHDSRPGSWCARIAKPGGRGIHHLAYDPHSLDGQRSVWGPAWGSVRSATGNTEALAALCIIGKISASEADSDLDGDSPESIEQAFELR
ncbi:hypothetical protein [Cryobacterium sp. SO1]|uniref:hypothetical protein n=1 Tax=Cryobacterium sp. SO1 TaxID=1897061 RepID=UPI001023BBA0|nr:hypothetical protein [Cryobacterium sp. SO1]RZI36981.1 hypothetical protein BJQ95_00648 [Cryobacterium sp. SO1]